MVSKELLKVLWHGLVPHEREQRRLFNDVVLMILDEFEFG